MKKIICDRCKKEIDIRSHGQLFQVCFDSDDFDEEWDLCYECFSSVKGDLVRNVAKFQQENNCMEG